MHAAVLAYGVALVCCCLPEPGASEGGALMLLLNVL